MSVVLNPRVEARIRQRIVEGPYRDVESVLDEALALLEDRDRRLQHLRELLAEGEKGEPIPYTPELLEEIDREVDERIRRGDRPNPDVCP